MFAAVPGNAALVVRSKGSTRMLYGLMLGATVLLVVLAVVLVLCAVWLGAPTMLIILPPFAVQLGFTALIVREYQGLLGPQLAADHTGVWVRTGMAAARRACTCRGPRSTGSTSARARSCGS